MDNQAEGNVSHSSAHALANLLEYVDGSIVSRTLTDKKTGTITLFAFAEGQGLSEHSAPFDAFVQVVEGELELVIGGQEVRATDGEIVIMPADVPHALRAAKPSKMLLVMIR
ncbi:MAG: cupin domain-containing protein [Deltaproteobacteria bacterium]|nr:cupin domain-containing protein [Deltaproteobacteria bacterium]